jgi:hypothetical protein
MSLKMIAANNSVHEGTDAVMFLHDPGGGQAWSCLRCPRWSSSSNSARSSSSMRKTRGRKAARGRGARLLPGTITAPSSAEALYNSRNDLPANMKKFNAARRREIRATLTAENGTPPSEELIRNEEERLQASAKAISKTREALRR